MEYDEFTISVLKSKLDERGLPVTGLKADLVSRLEHDDKRKSDNRLFSGAFRDRGHIFCRPLARSLAPVDAEDDSDYDSHAAQITKATHSNVSERRSATGSGSGSGSGNGASVNHSLASNKQQCVLPQKSSNGSSHVPRARGSNAPASNRSETPGKDNTTSSSKVVCLSDFNKKTLETICRDNWVSPNVDNVDARKRKSINFEYDRKHNEFTVKRDAAIQKANDEHAAAVANENTIKNTKIKGVDAEKTETDKKREIFESFFRQLKEVKASKGLSATPADCAPDAHHPVHPQEQESPGSTVELIEARQAKIQSSPAPTVRVSNSVDRARELRHSQPSSQVVRTKDAGSESFQERKRPGAAQPAQLSRPHPTLNDPAARGSGTPFPSSSEIHPKNPNLEPLKLRQRLGSRLTTRPSALQASYTTGSNLEIWKETRRSRAGAALESFKERRESRHSTPVTPKIPLVANSGSLKEREKIGNALPSSLAGSSLNIKSEYLNHSEILGSAFLPSSAVLSSQTNNFESFKTNERTRINGQDLKRKQSNSGLRAISTDNKRRQLSDDRSRRMPTSLRNDSPIESKKLWPEVNRFPLLFIPRNDIKVTEENFRHIQQMLKGASFNDVHVRAQDQKGYYLIFEDSSYGEILVRDCFYYFKGRSFFGKRIVMQLWVHGRPG